jgi:hypothetical protein
MNKKMFKFELEDSPFYDDNVGGLNCTPPLINPLMLFKVPLVQGHLAPSWHPKTFFKTLN